MKLILYLLVVLFIAGCSKKTDETPALKFEKSITLGVGQNSDLDTDKLNLNVLNVVDSRCPLLYNCIWAGMVTVNFEATYNNAKQKFALVLGAPINAEERVDTVFNYRIEMLTVLPYPEREYPKIEDYTIELHIEKLN